MERESCTCLHTVCEVQVMQLCFLPGMTYKKESRGYLDISSDLPTQNRTKRLRNRTQNSRAKSAGVIENKLENQGCLVHWYLNAGKNFKRHRNGQSEMVEWEIGCVSLSCGASSLCSLYRMSKTQENLFLNLKMQIPACKFKKYNPVYCLSVCLTACLSSIYLKLI